MPSDPAPTIPALPRPARWGAAAIRFLAFGLPARLLRAAFLPGAANLADLTDHQLTDIGVQRSDLPRGWGGAADAEIAARLGSGRDRSGW